MSGFKAFARVFCCLFLFGNAHAAIASCTEIHSPEGHVELERIKSDIYKGDFESALAGFEIEDNVKRTVAAGLLALVPNGNAECTTIRRIRQSDHFISEVFMTQAGERWLYWVISGQTEGDDFKMVHFKYTDEFNTIRELLY